MIFALVGNQNCGKTTLFNALTGSNQHVGNFPGVTVDQKTGEIRGEKGCSVVDLPGIYSLRPYTQEEIVSRDYILQQKPDGIINIVDATNIERNLYLTLQLLELRVPMVLALNMMDEVRANGGTVDVQKMSRTLGIPVVPISAAKGEGVSELVDQALSVARGHVLPKVTDFCADDSAVHRCIHAVVHLIADHADRMGVPARFCAAKLIEGGDDLADRLALDQNERELLEHCIVQMETETGLDRNAALADMRYTFIENVVDASVVKCHESREHARSVRLDRLLTGRFTADVLADLRRHRPTAVRLAVRGGGRPDGGGGPGADGLRHQPGGTQPYRGRHFCRCGQRAGVSAHHRDAVFLPVHSGRHRLHGPGGLRHGQAPAQDRPVRPQHRSHAHRLW